MYMRKSVIVLIVASIVTIAALASVSFGLNHVQAMMESGSFSGMEDHHMNYSNSAHCDGNMTSHMDGSTYSGHMDMHNQTNMTEYMQHMHEGHMAASRFETNHGACPD